MTDTSRMQPADPEFSARVATSFERQAIMKTLGARLASVEAGSVTIELPFRSDLTQQQGSLHAGVITTVVDSACGYAALSMMAPGADVVSVEFKVNLLAPAVGELFTASGRVVRSGRTITVCTGELHATQNGEVRLVAMMQATMMAVGDRGAVPLGRATKGEG